MTDALSYQHGGTHYLNMGMQPIEFAMANGWDAGAFSILKYLSRHASKNGLEDVKKARHFVELRDQFLEHVTVPDSKVPMSDYIARNGITGDTKAALHYLAEWVELPASEGMKALTLHYIDVLILDYEAGQEEMKFEPSVLR